MHKRRILVIDDSEEIHKDFSRLLCPSRDADWSEMTRMEDLLFGPAPSSASAFPDEFEMDSAFQGQEGLEKIRAAMEEGRPYELVFLDYRMPPGWNGFETLRRLRELAPALPVVLCSAYSDYSWEEIHREFSQDQALKELRKPFGKLELQQVTRSFTEPPATHG